MRAYKCHFEGLGSFITENAGIIADTIAEMDEQAVVVRVEIVEMTAEELEALLEFDGF